MRVESVLHVDEHGVAAPALRLGYEREAEGGLARGFGAVDFDDSAARQAADAEGEVYGHRPRAYRLDVHLGRVAEADERALPELFVYHAEGGFESLVVLGYLLRGNFLFCHTFFAISLLSKNSHGFIFRRRGGVHKIILRGANLPRKPPARPEGKPL